MWWLPTLKQTVYNNLEQENEYLSLQSLDRQQLFYKESVDTYLMLLLAISDFCTFISYSTLHLMHNTHLLPSLDYQRFGAMFIFYTLNVLIIICMLKRENVTFAVNALFYFSLSQTVYEFTKLYLCNDCFSKYHTNIIVTNFRRTQNRMNYETYFK